MYVLKSVTWRYLYARSVKERISKFTWVGTNTSAERCCSWFIFRICFHFSAFLRTIKIVAVCTHTSIHKLLKM